MPHLQYDPKSLSESAWLGAYDYLIGEIERIRTLPISESTRKFLFVRAAAAIRVMERSAVLGELRRAQTEWLRKHTSTAHGV